MINVIVDNVSYKTEWVEFSDGAITCKLDPEIPRKPRYISLSVDPATPCARVITEVDLILSSLQYLSMYSVEVYLNLPYLPFARGDRVFEEGNPAPLEVFLYQLAEVIRGRVTMVVIRDPHSEKYRDHVDVPWCTISQLDCFKESVFHKGYTHVVAPDKGAVEKSQTIADHLGCSLLTAEKVRDISTGKIKSVKFNEELPTNSKVIICDDIMDGGGTFIPLAEELKAQGCTVDLYVTHLIGSKGLDIFKGLIDNIYCYHTVGKHTNRTHILNFNEGI